MAAVAGTPRTLKDCLVNFVPPAASMRRLCLLRIADDYLRDIHVSGVAWPNPLRYGRATSERQARPNLSYGRPGMHR